MVLQLLFGLPFIAENGLPSLMSLDPITDEYDLDEVFYVLCGTSFFCDDDPFDQTLLPGVARVILTLFPAPDEPDVQLQRVTGWKFRHLKVAAKAIHEMHRRNLERIVETDGDIDEAVTKQVKQACTDALNYFSIQLRAVCSLSDSEVEAHCDKVIAQAKEFEEEIAPHFRVKGFWEKLGEMILDFVNSIPIVGHIKGVVHYAMGDTDAGNAAMIAASRSVFVAASACYGGGVVGALIAGAAFDTMIASIKAGAFQLGGLAAVGVELVRKVIDGENILGDLKDLVLDVERDVALGMFMKPLAEPFDKLVNKGLAAAMGRVVKPGNVAAGKGAGRRAAAGGGRVRAKHPAGGRAAAGGDHAGAGRPAGGGPGGGDHPPAAGGGGNHDRGSGGGGGGAGPGGGGDHSLHIPLPDHADFVDDNKHNRGGDVFQRNKAWVRLKSLPPGKYKAGDPFLLDGDIKVHPAYGDHPVEVHTEAYHALADGRSPAHPDFAVDVAQLSPLQKVRAQLFHRKAARSKSYIPDPSHNKQIINLENILRNADAPDGGAAFAYKHMADKGFGDDWGKPADLAVQKKAAAEFKNIRNR